MLLQEGDIFILKKKHKIYIQVKREDGSFRTEDVKAKTKNHDYTDIKFVVYKTSFSGGGTGHGPHDYFPNGHCVCAEDIEGAGISIHFYQTGCFTAMIKEDEISAIGKARRTWVELKKPQNKS